MINYHPILGITIFILSIIISYIAGRKLFFLSKNNKKINKFIKAHFETKKPPKGEVSSPDAPWLNKKNNIK